MPGRVFLTTPVQQVARVLGVSADAVAEEPPRRNIAPGQAVLALTATGLRRMRWGMIPVGRVNARGRPVMETIINARSETVFGKTAFADVGRAVLPVDGWYEWTGENGARPPGASPRNPGTFCGLPRSPTAGPRPAARWSNSWPR